MWKGKDAESYTQRKTEEWNLDAPLGLINFHLLKPIKDT